MMGEKTKGEVGFKRAVEEAGEGGGWRRRVWGRGVPTSSYSCLSWITGDKAAGGSPSRNKESGFVSFHQAAPDLSVAVLPIGIF